jgi:signal transduction histidine kinase
MIGEFLNALRETGRGRLHPAIRCYGPRLVLAALTLALLGAAAWSVSQPVDGITWELSTGRILSVDPGEPGDRAELKPGDVVLTVDGRPLAITPLYVGKRPGQKIVLTFKRGTDTRTGTLRLAAPSGEDRLWSAIPVGVGTSFWIAGLVVLALCPQDATCTAFFWFGQAAAAALAGGHLSTLNLLWASHLFSLALVWLPSQLTRVYIALVSPDHQPAGAVPRWSAAISALATLTYAVILAVHRRYAHTTSAWATWREGVLLYLGLTLLGLTLGVARSYVTAGSARMRRRLRGLAFGTAAGFVPFLLLSLLPKLAWGTGTGLPAQATFPFLVAIPLSHAYVIVEHDLKPLDRMLNRSLVVFTLGLLSAGLYLAGVTLATLLLDDARILHPLMGALVTVMMAAVFAPLREGVQRVVDRTFYGGWYDYRSVVAEVSQALGSATSRGALAERLVGSLVRDMRLQGAALYLEVPEGDGLALAGSQGLVAPDRLSISEDRDVQAQASSLVRSPDQGLRVLRLAREGQLRGVLLLGEKREDDFFAPADAEILRTLQEQATLAAENVLLLESLRQAATALEKAQRQLLAAREEERRVLSWELHDGPLQDLIALSYDLFECRDKAWQHDPTLGQRLEDVRRDALSIKRAVREVCSELRSDVLDVMGLGPAIQRHAYDLMQETDVTIYCDVPHRGPKLADPLGITLFRVFQEALSNAVEHAHTGEIWVSFAIENGAYELRVRDEGCGFPVPERLSVLAVEGHFGLATIKERAASIGAELVVRSTPGGGTHVRMEGEVDDGQASTGPEGSVQ